MAGGGTGGHVYPAIAIADAIRTLEPEAAVAFAGTTDHIEWKAVPRAGYAIHPVTVTGFYRELSSRTLAFPFKLMQGLKQSWDLVADFDADIAVGTGGYVSGPVLFAASLRGRPTVVQEQNAHAGVTNRLLARRATQVHIAFPEAEAAFPTGRCLLSGNPTRSELVGVDRQAARDFFALPDDAALLVVLGGSLGSQALNEAMQVHLDRLLADEHVHILWQTGERYIDRLQAAVPDHPRLRLQAFVDRMDYAYAAADLALCRAGAITCSELMVTGTPAVLVPSPNGAEDHQTKNALSMTRAGAARLLREADLQTDLSTVALEVLADPAQRQQMAEAAHRLAKPDAAETIARHVLGLLKRSP